MPAQRRTGPQQPPQLPVVRNALDDMLDQYQGNIAEVMPRHTNPETFFRLALAMVRRDKWLNIASAANPTSLVAALIETAALGHLPMKGTMSLVAYKSDREKHPEHNGWQITAIEEVGGVKQRIMRAGGVTQLIYGCVRQGGPKSDRARFQRTSMAVPYHEYDEYCDPQERGHLVAVYAYGILLSGAPSTVVWMPKDVVMKHRAKSRSGDAFWGPPWPGEGPWTEDMWNKTALHKLDQDLPSSIEYRWQLAASEAAAASMPRPPGMADKPATAEAGGGTDNVWEGDFTEADEAAPNGEDKPS